MSYSHLTIDERLCLHISYSAGMGVRKIAKELGRSRKHNIKRVETE